MSSNSPTTAHVAGHYELSDDITKQLSITIESALTEVIEKELQRIVFEMFPVVFDRVVLEVLDREIRRAFLEYTSKRIIIQFQHRDRESQST